MSNLIVLRVYMEKILIDSFAGLSDACSWHQVVTEKENTWQQVNSRRRNGSASQENAASVSCIRFELTNSNYVRGEMGVHCAALNHSVGMPTSTVLSTPCSVSQVSLGMLS